MKTNEENSVCARQTMDDISYYRRFRQFMQERLECILTERMFKYGGKESNGVVRFAAVSAAIGNVAMCAC